MSEWQDATDLAYFASREEPLPITLPPNSPVGMGKMLTKLHRACQRNHVVRTKKILKANPTLLEVQDDEGYGPLYVPPHPMIVCVCVCV